MGCALGRYGFEVSWLAGCACWLWCITRAASTRFPLLSWGVIIFGQGTGLFLYPYLYIDFLAVVSTVVYGVWLGVMGLRLGLVLYTLSL